MSHFPFFVSYLFCHLFFSLTGDIMLSLILLMIAAAVLLTACSPADTSADIYVYDYGQNENYYGDCVLLKSGHKAILMDTCSEGADVEGFLKEKEVDEFVLYISHYHNDHTGNAAKLIRDMHVTKVYLPDSSYMRAGCPGFDEHLADYYAILSAAAEKGCKIFYLNSGDSFEIGGARFDVLLLHKDAEHGDFADYDACSSYINNCSLVTMVTCGGVRFLTAGDIEKDTEAFLLASPYDLDADLFKMNHHGGITSNTDNFLAAVSPDYAFATFPGKTNKKKWVVPIRKLRRTIPVYNVFECGSVHFHLESGEIRVN